MPPAASAANAAPPPPPAPRWLRLLHLAALAGLLTASIAISTGQTLTARFRDITSPLAAHSLTHAARDSRWLILGDWPKDSALHAPALFAHTPSLSITAGECVTHAFLLIPALLLCALFCARHGVERGRALDTGTLPAPTCFVVLLLVFGVMGGLVPGWPVFVHAGMMVRFAAGYTQSTLPLTYLDALASGLFLLASFAVLRADPPAPSGVGAGWTVAAGGLALCALLNNFNAASSLGALALYVGWSAGWRRVLLLALGAAITGAVLAVWAALFDGPLPHENSLSTVFSNTRGTLIYTAAFIVAALPACWLLRRMPPAPPPPAAPEPPPTATAAPSTPSPLPMAPAHRITGFLLFMGWMGIPAAIVLAPRHVGALYGWEFIVLPWGLAAGLTFAVWLTRARRIFSVALTLFTATMTLAAWWWITVAFHGLLSTFPQ